MIIIFGPAGSGKSVQGRMLAERNNWYWLSAGELLRDSDDVELLKIMAEGELAPADKVNHIVSSAIKRVADADKIILDGFPRQIEQAKWLVENSPLHGHEINAILVIDVNKDEIVKRLKLRGRLDDNAGAIEERLSLYNKNINPVIDYFSSQGVNVYHVDGVGTIEEVHERIMGYLASCNLVK